MEKLKKSEMEPLAPGKYYHIYNHANGNEQLIREDKNYKFFLLKVKEYIVPAADIFAYCLMPNHFHLLIRIKDEEILTNLIKLKAESNAITKFQSMEQQNIVQNEKELSDYVSKQFSNLFSSYTQAYNQVYNRRGSLFLKNFKRKNINDDTYFIRLINYIHFNPVDHGFVNRPSEWKYSSYNAIISSGPTLVLREEVLNWFDGLANFLYCHLRPMEI